MRKKISKKQIIIFILMLALFISFIDAMFNMARPTVNVVTQATKRLSK